MTEFEQRLTDEFSKLAKQYAQEQKQLHEQVNSLGGYVHLSSTAALTSQGYTVNSYA